MKFVLSNVWSNLCERDRKTIHNYISFERATFTFSKSSKLPKEFGAPCQCCHILSMTFQEVTSTTTINPSKSSLKVANSIG
jgi:hypothetical protein